MPARDIPICVGAAYEQFVKGFVKNKLRLTLEHPQPNSLDPTTYSTTAQIGPINASNKGMLLFLACRDKEKDRAYAVWQEVKKLTGEGDAYEYQAAELLGDALWPPASKGYTRSQLKGFDDRVARAAVQLSNALRLHPDFCRESSAVNWPDDDADRIAKIMRGLDPVAWPDPSVVKENGAPIYHGLPITKRWQFDGPGNNELFALVAAIAPTMKEMLDVLVRRAKGLSSKRFKAKKGWQATGEADDTLFIRHLLAGMMVRNAEASAGQVAKIISPIVCKAFGIEQGNERQRIFDRCKKGAQTIRANIKADPELKAVAMLSNPGSPYWAGK